LSKELNLRKLEYKEYIKQNINNERTVAFTEENYHILFEEAVFYKEKVDSTAKEIAYLQ
jgi:hypothetical protein